MKEFNIQVASKLTGISVPLLRTWEKRYAAVTPKRNKSGHRQYSEKDIKKLRALKDLCSLGYNISELADKNLKDLRNLLKDMGVNENFHKPINQVKDKPEKAKESLSHLLLALDGFKLDVVSHEIYNLKLTLSPRDLALNVISPLLKKVGQYVEADRLCIAKEHALSSIIKFHLGEFVYRSYEEKGSDKDLIVLATPEGELHEFGILLASLLCTYHDKNFFYLGPNLPDISLIEAAHSINATHVILGTTNSTCSTESAFLTNYLEQTLKGLKKDVKLIVGGTGFFDTMKFQNKPSFLFMPTLNHLDHYLKNNM